jgi:hypothetical protein
MLLQEEIKRIKSLMLENVKDYNIVPVGNLNSKYGMRVYIEDLNGNLIKEWENIAQASRELNIGQSNISNVCRGKTKTSNGFIFKYLGDNDFSKNIKARNGKRVFQYDLKGNFIKEWKSASHASKELNIKTNISNACNGRIKTAGGFIWKYPDDNDFSKNIKGRTGKKVFQYDLKGNFIKEWKSGSQIQKELGFNGSNIGNCCNGKFKKAYNFIWKFKN